ncbi:hypothetical protein [Pseudoflavitalea rhizosphaerae]|uniref:hypothetical protein n=1 Tax=Pseudoflavitalea rhizosphaerae TaxID=1884793 RepID=UPI000F8E0C8A|nr:hypothetical protein [Pseudoflavitalea rhizosphaerae]
MSEIEIPVTWKGKELSFPARLQQTGYTHRILVDVDGVEIVLEPDEEKNYRAMLVDPDHPDAKRLDAGLIAAIVEVVESVVR